MIIIDDGGNTRKKEPFLLTKLEYKRSFGKALKSTHLYPPPAKGGMDRSNKGNQRVFLMDYPAAELRGIKRNFY